MDDIPRTWRYRILEILPGAVSWAILVVPIIAAYWFPRAVAIFVIIYVLLWFLRSLKSSIFLIYSYLKSKKFARTNWRKMLEPFEWQEIFHLVIIPTYKEEKEILEESLRALAEVDFPLERLIVVLATEERDRTRALANSKYLTKRFGKTFGQFHHIMHPDGLPYEIPAKGANISYAAKKMAHLLKQQNINFKNVIVTTLDADNRPHRTYFSNLTYHYLAEPNRAKRSFQPLAFFYNNIWEVPFTNRLIALANTFWYLAESGESHNLFNASVYAQSLETLVAMDFWSRQTIVEDLHQYWRTYFHFRGDHEVIPLFVPVYQDALQSRTYFTSLVGQYKQLRRWAWGASEIPYVIIKMWRERRRLPFLKSIDRLSYLCYLQITWATAPVIVLLNQMIPKIGNPAYRESVFAYNLSQIFSVIFLLMLIGITISLWVSLLSLPRPAGRFGKWRFFSSMLQWALLPFVTIIYGTIPAIDAQTRLMLNKPLGFTVTEKIRKIN